MIILVFYGKDEKVVLINVVKYEKKAEWSVRYISSKMNFSRKFNKDCEKI